MAPFLVNVLQNLSYILPFIVMSAVTTATCVLALTLPETNNRPTRENYEDFFDKVTDDGVDGGGVGCCGGGGGGCESPEVGIENELVDINNVDA